MSYVDRFFPHQKTEDEKCSSELDEFMRVGIYDYPNPTIEVVRDLKFRIPSSVEEVGEVTF